MFSRPSLCSQLDCLSPVCLLDLVLAGRFVDFQDLVVVFPLALLEFQLRIPDLFLERAIRRIVLQRLLELPDSLLPVARLAERLGLCLARLSV